MRIAVTAATISSARTDDRTFEPADELITLSILVVGALTTALDSRRIVVLDAAAVVAGVKVVVAARVVVVVRAVVRGAAVVGTVSGATVDAGVVTLVAAGPTVVVVGRVVVVDDVVEGDVVVVLDVAVVVGPVVLGRVVAPNTGRMHTNADSNTSRPNPLSARVVTGRDGRLTGSSSD